MDLVYRKHKNMKKIFFYTLICCAAAFSLTSCFDDGDDTELTDQEKASVIATFVGDFTGNIYSAYNPTGYDETQKDTTYAKISFYSDKTYTISNFPLNYIAEAIPENEEDLKEALLNYSSTDVTGQFDVASTSPASVLLYSISFSIMMNGASHDVVISLVPYYSYSQFTTLQGTSTKVLFAQFLPQYLYLDTYTSPLCEFFVDTGYGSTMPLSYSFVSDN